MSATQRQDVTHDVGERISWTLRPAISVKLNMVRTDNRKEYDLPDGTPAAQGGRRFQRRQGDRNPDLGTAPQEDAGTFAPPVIRQGRWPASTSSSTTWSISTTRSLPSRLPRPMKELQDKGYITAAPFDEKIEWTWWELWHHEGRRARHGAAMNGPDYTWWHGIYDVAQKHLFQVDSGNARSRAEKGRQ